jgi:hypothetical protein
VPRLQQLDSVILPGCVSLTWVSPNIDEYCDAVQKAVENFDLILKRANDLILYRIEAVLNDITSTQLCEINDEDPIAIDEFYRRTEELCAEACVLLQTKSLNIEEATEELIELLYPNYRLVFFFNLNINKINFLNYFFLLKLIFCSGQKQQYRTKMVTWKMVKKMEGC